MFGNVYKSLTATVLLACTAVVPGQTVRYRVYDLKPPLGNNRSFANAINSTGVAAGDAETAIVWTQGSGVRYLCPFASSGGQHLGGLNDFGVAAGYAVPVPNNSVHTPYVFYPGVGLRYIGLPPGSGQFTGEAGGVNNSGVVCGWGQKPGGIEEAWVWSPGQGFQLLGSIGGKGAVPAAINESGWVTGITLIPSNEFIWHAFLWTPKGGIVDLGVPQGYKYSSAFGVNDLGWVVGECLDAGGATSGFLWKDGQMEVVLPWGTGRFYLPKCVNNLGAIGGQTNTGAFLWTREGGVVDLNTVLDAQAQADGWWLGEVRSVNDSGWICGIGNRTVSGNNDRAFVAVPY